MKLLTGNSELVRRLFTFQIGIAIFSIAVNLAVNEAWGGQYLIWVSLFAILFYGYLLYTAAWEQGSKDIVRMEAGRLERSSWVGLKSALIADIPNAILCLLLFIGTLLQNISGNLFTIVLIIDGFFWGSMYYGIVWSVAVTPTVTPTGVVAETNAWLVTLCYFISLFVLPLVCHIGYVLGQKNFRLFKKNMKTDSATPSKNQK